MASGLLSAPPAPSVERGPRRGTRSRSCRRRRWGPLGGLTASAGSSGARRVAGALSGERAVSWSCTPVGRRAGLRRGAGAGARARGRGGPASGASHGRESEGRGGRLDRSARLLRAEAVWRRGPGGGRAGQGREPPAIGTALASAAPAVSLPDRSPGRYVLVAPFHRLGKERPRKEKKREGSQCAEPEPTGLNTGERQTPAATHELTRAGRSRVSGQPG